MYGHQRFIFGEISPKGDSARSLWRKFHFSFKSIRKEQCFLPKQIVIQCHWLASQEGFSIKWQQERRYSRNFLYSCFYLAPYRSRASKSGEPNTKPILFVWRFFFQNFKESVIEYSFNKRSVSHFAEISGGKKKRMLTSESPEVSLVATLLMILEKSIAR